jgi:hypothetical protein
MYHIICKNPDCSYAKSCHVRVNGHTVTMQSIVMVSAVMMSVIMISFVMMSVIMMSVDD